MDFSYFHKDNIALKLKNSPEKLQKKDLIFDVWSKSALWHIGAFCEYVWLDNLIKTRRQKYWIESVQTYVILCFYNFTTSITVVTILYIYIVYILFMRMDIEHKSNFLSSGKNVSIIHSTFVIQKSNRNVEFLKVRMCEMYFNLRILLCRSKSNYRNEWWSYRRTSSTGCKQSVCMKQLQFRICLFKDQNWQ